MNAPIERPFLRVVRAFAALLFDEGNGVPAERLDWIVREYAEFTKFVGSKTRLGFRGAIIAIQLFPLFFVYVPLPFTWLSDRLKHKYVERLEASRWTFLVTALKVPMSIRYFEHPEVARTLGYDARPLRVLADDAPITRLAIKSSIADVPAGTDPHAWTNAENTGNSRGSR